MNRVLVISSAYNEAENLPGVVASVTSQCPMIIVDDGSSDETAAIARQNGAQVISHIYNLGQGYAFLTGMKAALARDVDYIIYMDSDGQHSPEELHVFIKKFEMADCDVVVGSRILGNNYKTAPFLRKFFLPYVTGVVNWLTGYRMTDAMCGFRAYKKSSLKSIAHLFDQMLEPQYIAAEMFMRFAREELRVEEVPITLSARHTGTSYKGAFRYGMGIFRAILKTLLDKRFNT